MVAGRSFAHPVDGGAGGGKGGAEGRGGGVRPWEGSEWAWLAVGPANTNRHADGNGEGDDSSNLQRKDCPAPLTLLWFFMTKSMYI